MPSKTLPKIFFLNNPSIPKLHPILDPLLRFNPQLRVLDVSGFTQILYPGIHVIPVPTVDDVAYGQPLQLRRKPFKPFLEASEPSALYALLKDVGGLQPRVGALSLIYSTKGPLYRRCTIYDWWVKK